MVLEETNMDKRDDRSVARVTCRSGNRALTSSANSLTTNVDISKFMKKKAFCGRGAYSAPPVHPAVVESLGVSKIRNTCFGAEKKVKINEKRFFYTQSKKHAVFFMTNWNF